MKIENYISQLLYRYQCVTIPNFGAFLTEIQSAKINEDLSTFYAPTKLISFNSYLKNNDGLLANQIAQTEKISYDEAVFLIKNQVAIWNDKLETFGGIVIKNIGEFELNNEKKLVFSPLQNVNYLTDSFGLINYTSPDIKRFVAESLNLNIVEEVAEKEIVEKQIPIINLPVKRSNYSYLKYAAVFALGISIAGTFGYKYYENKITLDTLAVQKKVQKEVNQKIQEATFFISIPETTLNLNVVEEKKPFHVVAGAFSKEINADKQLKRLLKQGFDAKRIEKNKSGWYPVIYGSYTTYELAHEAMAKIQKNNNPDAWVLIQE